MAAQTGVEVGRQPGKSRARLKQ